MNDITIKKEDLNYMLSDSHSEKFGHNIETFGLDLLLNEDIIKILFNNVPIGTVISQPRVNDKRGDAQGQRQRFTSKILPPYLRRTKSLDELIPWLYLRGISTGDFTEALQALLGPQAKGLSATNIVRLKESWQQEWKTWSQRSLEDKRYVYVWADGIHFNIRLEDAGNNLLEDAGESTTAFIKQFVRK